MVEKKKTDKIKAEIKEYNRKVRILTSFVLQDKSLSKSKAAIKKIKELSKGILKILRNIPERHEDIIFFRRIF